MLIDITRTIGFDTLDYPSDFNTNIKEFLSHKNGDDLNMFYLSMTNHCGTHLDAPLHLIKKGKNLNNFKISDYIFNCVVIESYAKKTINLKDVSKIQINNGDAVLFKTQNSKLSRKEFSKEFVYLSDEVTKYLADKKIRLVGIDYLSVESFYSSSYPVHKILLSNNILILEDALLKNIKPGRYKLYCFPLKIKNANGAPVRAFLETIQV